METICPTWVLKSGKSEIQSFDNVLLSHIYVLVQNTYRVLFKTRESLSSTEPSHMHCSFLDYGA